MAGYLWRTLIAVIACLLLFALMPPVFRLIGFEANGDALTIIKVCVGGLALCYILFGPKPSWSA